MDQSITKDTVVFYHAECFDGFSAAWAVWKKIGDNADYVALFHGRPMPVDVKNKNIIFVDFLPKEDALKKIIADNISVLGIDHHKTNSEKVKLVPEYSFDLSKSGAVLAWEYFHKEPVPLLLKYVQDMDLWEWKLENSKEINITLELADPSFNNWDILRENIENPEQKVKLIEEGKLLLKYQEVLVKDIIKGNAQMVEFDGYKVFAVNSSVFHNEIGNTLSITHPPFGIIWQQRPHSITIGLRSNRTVDVGAIANKYGGGGHVGAAGFEIPIGSPFPWKLIRENKR